MDGEGRSVELLPLSALRGCSQGGRFAEQREGLEWADPTTGSSFGLGAVSSENSLHLLHSRLAPDAEIRRRVDSALVAGCFGRTEHVGGLGRGSRRRSGRRRSLRVRPRRHRSCGRAARRRRCAAERLGPRPGRHRPDGSVRGAPSRRDARRTNRCVRPVRSPARRAPQLRGGHRRRAVHRRGDRVRRP